MQANLVVFPKSVAFDFLLFCHRNPKPSPLLDVTEIGDAEPPMVAPGSDLRTDLPGYCVFRHGELIEEVTDIKQLWRDDLVAFLIGCSFSFACITTCNYLIVCGVYNWGATALLGAIYLLRPEWKAGILEGLNPDIEFRILETIVNAGLAVDGITGVQSLTVDNLFWDFHAQVLQMMIEII